MKTKGTLIFAPLIGMVLAGSQSSADPNHLPGGYSYKVPNSTSRDNTSVKLGNIRIGMAKAEVQSILGAPDSTSAQANAEYMVYYLELPTHVDSFFRDRPYVIRLVNGKVESFGRIAELFDLHNRPITTALPGQPGFPQPANNPGGPLPPPPVVVKTDSPTPTFGLAEELKMLEALKDQSVLSDEEFQKAKARLLSQPRSEEHTSELQSLRHLVCRLLLEKKNKNHKHKSTPLTHLLDRTTGQTAHVQ